MDNTPIQIVNDLDEPIGSATINDAYNKALLHRVVYTIIEDRGGLILLQKRGQKVLNYPGCWDISSAGHVDANEDYEATAKRETYEELGIPDLKLKEVNYFRSDEKHDHHKMTLHRFNKLYKAVIPNNTTFKLQSGEVAEAKWFTLNDIKKLIAEHPDKVASGLKLCIERQYENHQH